jgi:hypothetical protein
MARRGHRERLITRCRRVCEPASERVSVCVCVFRAEIKSCKSSFLTLWQVDGDHLLCLMGREKVPRASKTRRRARASFAPRVFMWVQHTHTHMYTMGVLDAAARERRILLSLANRKNMPPEPQPEYQGLHILNAIVFA